jgi:hypothetical protein
MKIQKCKSIYLLLYNKEQMMELVSVNGNHMNVFHESKQGKKYSFDLTVDAKSKKFIKENLNNISYDITNQNFKLRNFDGATTIPRALGIEYLGASTVHNVLLKDGNICNLSLKNLDIA